MFVGHRGIVVGMISWYPTVVPSIRQAGWPTEVAEAYSPLGGPVAVDKMEEVQLRNKAGRIRTFRPRRYRNSDGQGGATGTNMERPGYRNLDVHGNVT